jgi:peptidoglycan/xylan/chitin deacetylase (PgdA/CDA1 family)
MFHSVFESREELQRGLIHPQEGLTTQVLGELVDAFLSAGYRFVGVPQVDHGLEAGGRYAALTFDDGYANNLRAVPVLREYGVPATLFVATGHTESGRRFWWDVVYRERRRRGASLAAVEREIAALKGESQDWIAAHLTREFGGAAGDSTSELDRPLTSQELGSLAREKLVTLGNHTVDHAILPSLNADELRRQIEGAQEFLEQATGERPIAIAYPNGDTNSEVRRVSEALGLRVGFATIPRREPVPVRADRRLALGRFRISGSRSADGEIALLRSPIQIGNGLRRLRNWHRGR